MKLTDAAVAVIVVNIAIGTYQEGKAEAATKAIKGMVSAKARAQRNGRTNEVDSSQLVPGDVISLASGDRIPADVRWLTCSNLQVTEAALTGESTPISKSTEPVRPDAPLGDRACMGFSGTLVFTGQGDAVVVATGDSAQIGTINKLMTNVEVAKTPLLQQVHVVSCRHSPAVCCCPSLSISSSPLLLCSARLRAPSLSCLPPHSQSLSRPPPRCPAPSLFPCSSA